MENRTFTVRSKRRGIAAACLAGTFLTIVGACTSDDSTGSGSDQGGAAGEAATGGANGARGGTAGTGGGGSASGGRSSGGAAGRAGSAGRGGAAGEAGSSSLCIDEYDLPNYTGSTDGLCPARDSAHRFCCWEDGFDLAGAGMIYCSAEADHCYLDEMFCTRFESGNDGCDWSVCGDPDSTGAGGEGGGPPAGCPSDLRCDWDSLSCEGYEPTGTPCASDAHCDAGAVCNQRIGNRMFCGDAP